MSLPEENNPPEETEVPETEVSPETEASSETEAAPEAESVPEVKDTTEELRLIEALLFASSSPLEERSIAERLPEGTDVAALVQELVAFYAPRGVNIVKIAGGWTLRTAPDLAPRMKLTQKVGRKLSRAAIETLAVVAYHQPVTRAEIEEIRGVVISRGTLDTLMEAGWILPKGRKQTVGRPATWVTTEAFLMHFGLASLADLPGIEELRAAGLIGARAVALSETIGAPGSRLPDAPGGGGDAEDSAESDEMAQLDAADEAEEAPHTEAHAESDEAEEDDPEERETEAAGAGDAVEHDRVAD
jgi:segregation and condensation protein B